MIDIIIALSFVSGISFVAFGASCLASSHIRDEFERFGLAKFRTLVGVLELLGGSAQLLGWLFPVLGLLSSGGLTLLMVMGVITRLKIGDHLLVTLPAIAYLLLNAYLLAAFLTQ